MAEAKKTVTKKPASKKKAEKELIIKEQEVGDGNNQESSQVIAESGSTQEVAPEPAKPSTKATTKAGKRSDKGKQAAAEKQAKIERQQEAKDKAEGTPDKKAKQPQKPARTRLARRGKKFREVVKLIEAGKTYPLNEAIALAVKTSPVRFDATVELHVNLNVDPKQADQNIRGTVVLPGGSGKNLRVAVFDDEKVADADLSGIETITKALDKGQLNFDILIAPPAQMPKLGKYARLLGPKGLMPNPKSGTVTTNLAKAVEEAKAGRVEYRVDSTGIVHVGFGKVSFGEARLLANAQALVTSLKSNKPASVKGNFISSTHLSTTMGPSIPTLLE